jgi:hypothetical protein
VSFDEPAGKGKEQKTQVIQQIIEKITWQITLGDDSIYKAMHKLASRNHHCW